MMPLTSLHSPSLLQIDVTLEYLLSFSWHRTKRRVKGVALHDDPRRVSCVTTETLRLIFFVFKILLQLQRLLHPPPGVQEKTTQHLGKTLLIVE